MSKTKKLKLPKVGDFCHFWEDGKLSINRHYICRIEYRLSLSDVKYGLLASFDGINSTILYEMYRKFVNNHRYLMNRVTDYIIVATCPQYMNGFLYFARAKDGGFFSINDSWYSGRLDVDGSTYKSIIDDPELPKELMYMYENCFYLDDINLDNLPFKVGDWVETCKMLPGKVLNFDINEDDVEVQYPDGSIGSCSIRHCGVHSITDEYANILINIGEDELSKLWSSLPDGSFWDAEVEKYYNENYGHK